MDIAWIHWVVYRYAYQSLMESSASMTRRDWWIGVVLIVLALVLHAAIPRYGLTVRADGFVRFDRWTGRAEVVLPTNLARVPWVFAR